MSYEQDISRRELIRRGAGMGAALLGGAALELAVPIRSEQAEAAVTIEKYLPRSHFIRQGPSNRPNVAITIDDFYGTGAVSYLDSVLDIGRHRGIHFTFFPVGQAQLENFNARPQATRNAWTRAIKEGHSVGNHTYDHRLLGSMSTSRIQKELRGQVSAMNRVLGFKHHEVLMRPPGGDGGFPSIRGEFEHTLGAVRDLGYYMTMWTVDSNAPNGAIVTPNEDDRFLQKIFHDPAEHARNGSIILVHPTTLSVNGVNRLINGLKERHLQPVSVPELFEPAK